MASVRKHIYFVRHGQSVSNTQKLIAASEPDQLSDQGRTQVHQIAERITEVSPEVVLSSDLARAEHTAAAIAERSGTAHETHELLQEMTVPSQLIDCERDDSDVQVYFRDRSAYSEDPSWRYSDEENFYDLVARTHSILQMLTERSEEVIVVVTHAVVLRALIGCVLFGDDCDGRLMEQYSSRVKTTNTGITECHLEEKSDGSIRWALIGWNDRAHLTASV